MNNRSIFFAGFAVLACITSAVAQVTSPQPTASGQQLVLQSARNLFDLSGLEAEFRFHTQAYDQALVGSGRYLQAGQGAEKMFRLELSSQLEEGKATQQTICGKQYLWIRRDFGPERQSLARVNLRRLRQAIEASGEPLAVDPSPSWMGIVSLPKMLGALGAWFVFDPALESRLGDRQVLRVRGVINTEMRDTYLGKKGQTKEQIPDAVELVLGADLALPLFPYRIEYLKQSNGNEHASELAPVLTIDFVTANVQNNLDPRQFEYFPGDQDVEDRTRLFLDRLGFAVKEER